MCRGAMPCACLVFLIGAIDPVADVHPVLIAEVREPPEVSSSTAEESPSIDDGFARQVVAVVSHQEGSEIPQLLHLPHAAHRVVGPRGIVPFVRRRAADRTRIQALPCALRRKETGASLRFRAFGPRAAGGSSAPPRTSILPAAVGVLGPRLRPAGSTEGRSLPCADRRRSRPSHRVYDRKCRRSSGGSSRQATPLHQCL